MSILRLHCGQAVQEEIMKERLRRLRRANWLVDAQLESGLTRSLGGVDCLEYIFKAIERSRTERSK